jgi:hypothetical protein
MPSPLDAMTMPAAVAIGHSSFAARLRRLKQSLVDSLCSGHRPVLVDRAEPARAPRGYRWRAQIGGGGSALQDTPALHCRQGFKDPFGCSRLARSCDQVDRWPGELLASLLITLLLSRVAGGSPGVCTSLPVGTRRKCFDCRENQSHRPRSAAQYGHLSAGRFAILSRCGRCDSIFSPGSLGPCRGAADRGGSGLPVGRKSSVGGRKVYAADKL